MTLDDDGQMREVAQWVNLRVIQAELQAFRGGAPVAYIAPITLWGLARQFYVEQLEDHDVPGATFTDSEPAVQLACMLDLMRRGAQELDAMVTSESESLISSIEEMLRPGSVLDTDEPAGTETWQPPEVPDA